MGSPVCSIDTIVQGGEYPYKIIGKECGLPPAITGSLSLAWARATEHPVYDLDGWARLTQRGNPSLQNLPINVVKENIMARVAKELGATSSPSNLSFVLVKHGESFRATVHEELTGSFRLELKPESIAENPIPATRQNYLTWGCFPGDAFLRLSDGTPIEFAEYARLYGDADVKPAVASWNPETGEAIYQSPVKVLVHPDSEHEVMLEIQCTFGNGIVPDLPLVVTDKHELLTGAGTYIRAIDLKIGSALITEGGQCFINPAGYGETQSVVYNLSFNPSDNIPNYLVSPDGAVWYIAHNIELKL